MKAIWLWFLSKNISSQRIAALAITAATIYTTSPAVSAFVNRMAGGHKELVVELVCAVIALSKLSHSTEHPAVAVQP